MKKDIFNKYGFLLFDEDINKKDKIVKNLMSGTGCVANGEVFEFNKIKELPSGIIWFTNLEKDQVWRTGSKYIKNKYFLGLSYDALLNNLFITNDKKSIVKTMAELFNQAMLMLEKFLNIQEKSLDLTNEVYEHIYENFFYQKSYPPNRTDVERYKFSEAYIENINSPERNTKNLFTFYFEPNYLLNEILKENIPSGKWLPIENSFYKEEFKKQIDKIIFDAKNNIKSLVKIDYLKIKNEFSSNKLNEANLWLGTRGWQINGSVLDEMYLTEKEVEFLAQHAEFKILEVIQNAESKNLDKFYKSKLFNEELLIGKNELKKLSLTYQIINRLFLKAFISTGYFNKDRKKFPFTENMIWFRAKEREICFNMVKEFHNQGLQIKKFGNGEVTIFIENKIENRKAFVETLLDNHIIVPYFLCSTEIDQKKAFSYNLIDYYVKNKFIKNNVKTKDGGLISQDLFSFINKVAFLNDLYDKEEQKQEKEQEIKKLFAYLQSINFTKTDEENSHIVWFLNQIMENLKK